MKRLAVVLSLVASLHVTAAQSACDPAGTYQAVKAAVLLNKPSTAAEFDRIMSGLGLTQDEHVWKCEGPDGNFLTAFIPGKRWIHLDYAPSKSEKVPDAILSILAARAHAEPAGPRWIQFEYKSDEKTLAALKSQDVIEETITVSLADAIYEGTQCTIKLGAKAGP